ARRLRDVRSRRGLRQRGCTSARRSSRNGLALAPRSTQEAACHRERGGAMKRCPEAKSAALHGFGPEHEAHARACPECMQERAEVSRLRSLVEELPYEPPSAKRTGEIRDLLIALPARQRPRSYKRAVLLVASVACVALAGGVYRAVVKNPREIHF